MITQDLGIATAYGYAKSKGYTGTEAEFAELMASYASTAQTAIEAADRAVEANTAAQSAKISAQSSASTASTAAQTATSKASEAVTAAGTATTKASEASQSATSASQSAESAGTSAQTATTAATTATTKASEASESATTATTAKTDAETARDAAAQSASEAAESARTLTIDATLTQSGQAADSKAVGDKFESITAKTRNIADVGIGRYSFNNNTGVISHKPSNANILGLSDKIACEPETEYAVSLYPANDLSPIAFYVAFYSETEYLSQIYMPNRTRNVVKTPANTKYFCVYWYKGTGIPFDDNTHIQIEEGYISTEYIAPTSGYDVVARQGETVNIPYTEHKGYFNPSGTIAVQTSSKEYYTEKIDLALFKSIGASVEYPTEQSLWLACATYDENGDFIERVVFANLTNTRAYGQSINVNNNVRYIAFTYRKFDDGILKIFGSLSESGVAAKIISHSATKASLADGFQFRFKPCYDHLFVNKSAENTVIPHESLYHVRISKALGFNIIEANIASTSDGVYIVNHLNSGKFGKYFHHADGQTDISDIAVSSVTWDWICQNARYNSTLKKYQTRPSRVEEFLSECRQQNIIPFIYSADPAVLEIADNYMGKNNYIAYNAEREKCPTAIIYRWAAETSKEEIIEYCEKVGKPLIYGMSNPTAFTDAELREIIDALHTRGFWIGCSYVDYDWHKYSAMGIDLNGTQSAINRMQCGNLYNFDTLLSFDDFNVTGASEVDGELVFSTNGTIEPDINDTILSLGAVDIEISFSGTITMHGIGERTVAYTYTSDGTLPFFVATPIIGGSPKFTVDVTSGTIVKDIKFKASKL